MEKKIIIFYLAALAKERFFFVFKELAALKKKDYLHLKHRVF